MMAKQKNLNVARACAGLVVSLALALSASCSDTHDSGPASASTVETTGVPPALVPDLGAGSQPVPSASAVATALATVARTGAPTERPAASPAPPSPTGMPRPAAPTQKPPAQAPPQPQPPPPARAGQPASPQEAFIRSVVPYAQTAQADSGVPASFSIALAAAETGWGASPLMKQHNNYHMVGCSKPNEGLPCAPYGDGMWNAYSSPEAGFLWFGRWLRGHQEYNEAFNHTDDVATFVRLVVHCYVSCAGPFPQKVYDGTMKIINDYNLTQYDRRAG